jgi:hypothetical protein
MGERVSYFLQKNQSATKLILDLPVITGKCNEPVHFISFMFNPDMEPLKTIHVSPLYCHDFSATIDGFGLKIWFNEFLKLITMYKDYGFTVLHTTGHNESP